MEWLQITQEEAGQRFDEFKDTGRFEYDSRYESLRNDLCVLFKSALKNIGITADMINQKNNSYLVDIQFGIKLYTTLESKYGMNVRTASTDGVWRYLCVCVVPDLVAARYGTEHPDRFWKKSRRLWLRVIWWYIYLSWQGSEKDTYNVLKNNSTGEILQLVDRCGKGGYRVELYRALMRRNSEIDPGSRRRRELFRKMMVLNTARVQVVEPELTDGGCAAYVKELSEYFL